MDKGSFIRGEINIFNSATIIVRRNNIFGMTNETIRDYGRSFQIYLLFLGKVEMKKE